MVKRAGIGEAKVAIAASLGAAIGGALRMGAGEIAFLLGLAHHWATAFANVSGSLAIGVAAAWFAAAKVTGSPASVWQAFVITGVCGGYTTFSILSAETLALVSDGRVTAAAANILGSLLLAVVAAWWGYRAGERWMRSRMRL